MAHTYTVLLYHIIFSTKGRQPLLTVDARSILFPYMAGIITNQGGKALIVNGVSDHVHILCRLRSKPDVADVVQAVKGGSSAWFNQEAGLGVLHWQEGYGAFTVSYSQQNRVYRYIQQQEAHHRERSFAEEYEEFLTKNGVEYDRRFFLD
jgi:REP element-mobilizing transposase RayT